MVPEKLFARLNGELDELNSCVCGVSEFNVGRASKDDMPKKIADVDANHVINQRRFEKIIQIERVLLKLKSGWDGNCIECGEEIPMERLMMVPTLLCRTCTQIEEDRKKRGMTGRYIVQ